MAMTVEFKNVSKRYGAGESETFALNDVSFGIEKGEFVVILGPSGAGKSTLLNLLGGTDSPTSGEITVDGERIESYDEKRLTRFRADKIGFVFQFYSLIPTLTVYENVALVKEIMSDAADIDGVLGEVGLDIHRNKFPSQLSGGEQQRVSIARAVVKNPKLLLCDEPTGALDTVTGVKILSLLQETARKGHTVLIVTHNAALKDAADRVIYVKNGRIGEIVKNDNPISVEEVSW
ncbi:MAG: ABC transporter ATP-binding protein [Clostridiales bacterium]|jgi:putative ABC transport system ATP-binding protein|nr:ABC transporter ATP-binding protein [Clostridiales bacterium]